MGIAIWLGNDTGRHVNKEESPRLEIWASKEFQRPRRKVVTDFKEFQGTSRDASPNVCCNISQHLGWFESIQPQEIHGNLKFPQLNPYLWGHYQHDSSFLPVTCRVSWWRERQGCRVMWWTLWSTAFLYIFIWYSPLGNDVHDMLHPTFQTSSFSRHICSVVSCWNSRVVPTTGAGWWWVMGLMDQLSPNHIVFFWHVNSNTCSGCLWSLKVFSLDIDLLLAWKKDGYDDDDANSRTAQSYVLKQCLDPGMCSRKCSLLLPFPMNSEEKKIQALKLFFLIRRSYESMSLSPSLES